jgi:hypothetical protein
MEAVHRDLAAQVGDQGTSGQLSREAVLGHKEGDDPER